MILHSSLSRLLLVLLALAAPRTILGADADLVPGTVWIRIRPEVRITSNTINLLQLPPNASEDHFLLPLSQCVALTEEELHDPALTFTHPSPHATKQAQAILEQKLTHTLVVHCDGTVDVQMLCKRLRAMSDLVQLATPVYRNRLQYSPNDQYFDLQSYLVRMKLKDAWDISRGDSSVIIAVSDAGLRSTHEDLKASIARNILEIPNNGKDDDNNGYIDDYAGYNFAYAADGGARDVVYNPSENHGTCVSGILAAQLNNGIGVSGIAGLCKIVPLKIDSNQDPGSLDYGYESILYAAIRGASIVNCSWGNDKQGFNPMEQDVIDYAISRGTCVVVSGGNHNGRPTTPFYPANYRNILSVQETDLDGIITSSSSYGAHTNISAPGSDAVTTDNDADNSYTLSAISRFGGTSSAAPMVSGVLALVRSHFPQLTPQQAMQHVRITGDVIESANPTIKDYVCRNVNAKNALSHDPFSSPSIRITKTVYRNSHGAIVEQASVGDTLSVTVSLKNILGTAKNLRCSLSALDPNGTNSVHVPDSTISVAQMLTNDEVTLVALPVIITQANTARQFLRFNMIATAEPDQSEYKDFDLIEFYATQDFITLTNGSLRFSLGDYGWIGSNQFTDGQRKGDGFSYPTWGNLLYRGGLICTSTSSKVRSGLGSDGGTLNNFSVVSRSQPWPYILTISDLNSTDESRMGVEIEHRWTINDHSLAVCDLRIRNKGDNTLSDFAIGYFLDWDLTSLGDSCTVRRFSQVEREGRIIAAEIEERTPRNAVVAAMAISHDVDAQPQAAGLDATFIAGNFPDDQKFKALNSGTTIQASGRGDMSMVVGMKYGTALSPGATRQLRLVFGAAPTADSLALLMRDPFLDDVAEEIPKSHSPTISMFPNPATERVSIQLAHDLLLRVTVQDLRGEQVAEMDVVAPCGTLELDTSPLASGYYLVSVLTSDMRTLHAALLVQH